jgi:hypothetical protein
VHDPEPDADAERQQPLPGRPDELPGRPLDPLRQRPLGRPNAVATFDTGTFLMAVPPSSRTRLTPRTLPTRATRQENRRSKPYQVSDNLGATAYLPIRNSP